MKRKFAQARHCGDEIEPIDQAQELVLARLQFGAVVQELLNRTKAGYSQRELKT